MNAKYSVHNAKFVIAVSSLPVVGFLVSSYCMPFMCMLMFSVSFMSVSIVFVFFIKGTNLCVGGVFGGDKLPWLVVRSHDCCHITTPLPYPGEPHCGTQCGSVLDSEERCSRGRTNVRDSNPQIQLVLCCSSRVSWKAFWMASL